MNDCQKLSKRIWFQRKGPQLFDRLVRYQPHQCLNDFFVSGNIIVKMIPMLFHTANNVPEFWRKWWMESPQFLSPTALLEERGSLMHIFHLYPALVSPRQDFTDHICHSYGLSLLLLGLFMELAVQLVKIPDRVINTQGIEWLMFSIAFVFIMGSTYMICRLSWFLLRPQF